MKPVLSILLLGMLSTSTALAQSDFQPYQYKPQSSYLVAQVDPDEAYDPFADYSEFDEDSEEEADINFFRNGRFLTAALMTGYRGFTGGMATNQSAGATYGLQLSYFFDLRLAMSLGFQTGDHAVSFKTSGGNKLGNVSITHINFSLKYYMNTQNVTKGLADLNPYIIGGFGQNYRTFTFEETGSAFSKDSTMGFDGGVGLEIPMMRRKAYLGVQGTYHFVSFNDENKSYFQGTDLLSTKNAGDFFDLMFLLGMNF